MLSLLWKGMGEGFSLFRRGIDFSSRFHDPTLSSARITARLRHETAKKSTPMKGKRKKVTRLPS